LSYSASTLLRKGWIFLSFLFVLCLSAVLAHVAFAAPGGQAGTTLSAEKSATGFWEVEYDWSVDKSTDQPADQSLKIPQGTTGTINYTINATRNEASETAGVRGEICVTNGGDRTTENLKLVDQVEYKTGPGQFQPLDGATQTIVPSEQLGPGESKCYPYEIEFSPVDDAQYRNSVKVTITNPSGHLGEEFGPEPKADFSLPDSPAVTDETAQLRDSLRLPAGYTLVSGGLSPNPQKLDGSATINYSTEVRNDSAACKTNLRVKNTVKLKELDSGQLRYDSAKVKTATGKC